MHRMSAMDDLGADHSPLDGFHAHHRWLRADRRLGAQRLQIGGVQLHRSRTGSAPFQHRGAQAGFGVGAGQLESLSPNWSLQTSWGHLTSPEQLEPTVNEDRVTASAIYTRPVGVAGWWSTTLAFGSKRELYGQTSNGWLIETALHPNPPWTLFARAESEQNNELPAAGEPVPAVPGPTTVVEVSKLSLGVIHDWIAAAHAKTAWAAFTISPSFRPALHAALWRGSARRDDICQAQGRLTA